MFQISLDNYFEIEATLLYQVGLQPSEIDRMPYYRFEYLRDHIKDIIKERQKQQKDQSSKYSGTSTKTAMRDAKRNAPKTPSVGNVGTTNFPDVPSGLKG